MASFYAKFKELDLDLSPLGLEDRGPEGGYFCTPVGARCIGWPGVDGIHFCFVRGHREMVFAVSPMSVPGHYVHPIAKSFRDFLRLLLCCGVDALEQLWAWDREQFEQFVREHPQTEEARALLDRIAAEWNLKPMRDVYAYVKDLQEKFDSRTLVFPPEYDEVVMQRLPWTVYFSGTRMGVTEEREQPGREIVVNQDFDWESQHWRLLSVYVCGDGLVGDFCIQVDPDAEAAFLKKWLPVLEYGLDQDQEDWLQLENPFVLNVRVQAEINGEACRSWHGSQEQWNPCKLTEEGRERDAERWLEHYGCEREMGWIFLRTYWRHDWAGKQLETLTLTLLEDNACIPGPHFEGKAGTEISFTRPSTGEKHTLTVLEMPEDQTIGERMPREINGYVMPRCCRLLAYQVTPELPKGILQIQDCCCGDPPRPAGGEAHGGELVGILGGADGPTAVFFTKPECTSVHSAVSSLYFVLPEKTVWRMTFHEPGRAVKQVEIKIS